MDLASGYSDSFNYGNGYTPLANNAISNNNFNYNANQNYANLAGMYNPFAQSGGFGAMTDYYSNLGAAYGRATGGFGGGGGQANFPEPEEPKPPQPPAGAVDWGKYFSDLTAPAAAKPAYNPFAQYENGGYNPYSASTYAPAAQGNIGQRPQIAIRTPGSDGGNESVYYIDDPNWTPSGQGGIGSDTLRDQFAWQLAQSSPWATPQNAPANGPYPNLGYNPGMANSFANPAMQQYDWTKNNATLQQQMQDALRTIDGATGNQPAQPYGGQLPGFWQGVRDWTGMGAPQPTPGPQSNADGITPFRDTWTNAS